MNPSCPIGIFDQGPSHIPGTILKSNLSFQTTATRMNHLVSRLKTEMSEVIDIIDDTNECKNFNEYPLVVMEATGVRIKNKVIICGGQNKDTKFLDSDYNDAESQNPDKCYIGDQNGFKFLTKLPEKMSKAASLVYNDTMWLTGGYNKGESNF